MQKKKVFRREGLPTHRYVNNNQNNYIIQHYILSDDDMIHTYVNMYIVFVTPVMDDMGVENSILVRLRNWRAGRHTSAKNF